MKDNDARLVEDFVLKPDKILLNHPYKLRNRNIRITEWKLSAGKDKALGRDPSASSTGAAKSPLRKHAERIEWKTAHQNSF